MNDADTSLDTLLPLVQAIYGKGHEMDEWLEVNGEDEVRAALKLLLLKTAGLYDRTSAIIKIAQ